MTAVIPMMMMTMIRREVDFKTYNKSLGYIVIGWIPFFGSVHFPKYTVTKRERCRQYWCVWKPSFPTRERSSLERACYCGCLFNVAAMCVREESFCLSDAMCPVAVDTLVVASAAATGITYD